MKLSNRRIAITLTTVAVLLSIAVFSISVINEHVSEKMLKQQIYAQGTALTEAINKTNWKASDRNGGILHEYIYGNKSYDSITTEINKILLGTQVLKLKLYDPQGRLRYSSNFNDLLDGHKEDINLTDMVNLVALDVVKTKRPVSNYKLRHKFNDGKTEHKNRYIFSAYLPAFSPTSDSVEGVIEVYYDITGVISNFHSTRFVSNIILAFSGILLFMILAYLIIHNDKISRKKDSEREKYLAKINHKNEVLNAKNKELTLIKERVEKNAEEQFLFMSRMGHELRTPMNAVIGLTDLLLRTDLTNKQRGYIDAIQSSGNVLLDITDEILTVGRLEIGYLEIKQQNYVLRNVIEDVLEVMGNRAYKHDIELFCEYTPEIDKTVRGDPVRLRQILLNLVGNAIKYTKQGNVSIHVNNITGNNGIQYYRFEVRDTGIGIKKEDFSKIFAAYCHLNYRSRSFSKNTGLGLAISKRLVEAMNGVIGVESEVDQGSVFWFKLPLSTNTEKSKINQFVSTPDKKNSNVLIVTQGKESGESLKNSINKQFGIHVDLAFTVTEAHQYIEKSFIELRPYTLFFVDSVIHGECGVKFAHDIRGHTAFDNSYIVMMIPISASLQKGVVSGIDKLTCINKPILPGKLRSLIATFTMNYSNKINSIENLTVAASVYPNLKRCSNNESQFPNILVVDDNPINRELILEMLLELNYNAKAVPDGNSAINAVIDENFDLIILDCRLPDNEGYDVAAKIRRMKTKSRQPIIIVTSSDSSFHNQQLCFESGVDDFLHKPITLSDLSNALFSWLPEMGESLSYDIDKTSSTVVNIFSAPVLDKEIIADLKRRDKNNPDFFKNIVELFINDSFERINKLKILLEQMDYNGVERIAHSIQSGCMHLGAKRLAKYCELLSNMAKNQAYTETSRALQYFIEEFDRVLLELNNELRSVNQSV